MVLAGIVLLLLAAAGAACSSEQGQPGSLDETAQPVTSLPADPTPPAEVDRVDEGAASPRGRPVARQPSPPGLAGSPAGPNEDRAPVSANAGPPVPSAQTSPAAPSPREDPVALLPPLVASPGLADTTASSSAPLLDPDPPASFSTIVPAVVQPPPTAAPAPAPYDGPTSGTLQYAGPPVVQNGEVVFRNLPPTRLRLTYDVEVWDARLAQGENNTQRLILRNKKPGTQRRCEVRWEVIS